MATKKKKTPTLRAGAPLIVDNLTKEEIKILVFLGKGKGFPIFHLSDIQKGCFGTKMAITTRGKEKHCGGVSTEFDRKKGARYNSGVSTVRNNIRRLHRLKLVERPKTDARGEYRLTRKARKNFAAIKSAA